MRGVGRRLAWIRTRLLGRPLILADRRGVRYEVAYGEAYADFAGVPRWLREFTDDPGVLAYLEKTVKPGDVVVDIGAAVGVIALLAARLIGATGRVLAVEAEATNFGMLQRNVELNGFTNVQTCHLAITDHEGEAALNVFPRTKRGWHTLGGVGHRDVAASGVQRVPCTTIDALLEREKVTRVDLLKIDIEGAEPEAFAGAARSLARGTIRRIVFEVSAEPLRGMNHRVDDVLAPLRAAGYRISGLARDGRPTALDAGAVDAIYFANLVAVAPDTAS
jgi:FkbM family methyltransferase